MGLLLSNFKNAFIQDLITTISTNTAHYYAFASDPANTTIDYSVTTDDYRTLFFNDWNMLFGKKLSNTNVLPVIKKIEWVANTVYTQYDNTANNISNTNFYVVIQNGGIGSSHNIFKCINNANGSPSTQAPSLTQHSSFTTSDGYTWRYITSVSDLDYKNFSIGDYIPIYSNSSIVSTAYDYSGVDNIVITNAGEGYLAYHEGIIGSYSSNVDSNTYILQINNYASASPDFYVNNAIYIYNETQQNAQLKTITHYVPNSQGNFVYLDSAAVAENIIEGETKYIISPKIKIDSDSPDELSNPLAYSTVNTSSNVYNINSIVIIDPGYGLSWANVSIQSSEGFGQYANAYAIVPPPGGHGSNPMAELDVKGFCFYFNFSGSEIGAIPSNVNYSKIGIIKDPGSLTETFVKGDIYTEETFDATLKANVVSLSSVFTVGDEVYGEDSGARGKVAFANSTMVYLTGDQNFLDAEKLISSSDNTYFAEIEVSSRSDIYKKDIVPVYIQRINNVTRSNTSSEAFKLLVLI